MKITWIIAISCIIISETTCGKTTNKLSFPDGFKFGAATSSFQIEGAWNVSDKGENIWEHWSHNYPWLVSDQSAPDVACNSYYKYKEDVQLVKDIGFNYYRFSISWPRVLPTGFANNVSKDGLRYYKNLIDTVLAKGLEPLVTIYHFDHPQMMENMGGWTNELMVDYFVDYARLIFREFGHKVKIFLTINEPQQLCAGYREERMAPGKELLDIGEYQCLYNILKAHARTYHMYHDEFGKSQHGQIGLPLPCDGYVLDESGDTDAPDTAFQFRCGIIAHPIHVGDWPKKVKERVALVSKMQGYRESRLPELTPDWIEYIRGTADFFGLNHYTSGIYVKDPDEAYGKYTSDSGVKRVVDSSWGNTSATWLNVVPEGFGNLLRKIKTEYNNPPVYVLENGCPDYGELDDYNRIRYYHSYLTELIIAMKRDHCRVLRYTVWSLLDNFELAFGYTQPYGIVKVDFDSPDRTRTPKLSAHWWNHILRTRKLQDVPRVYRNNN